MRAGAIQAALWLLAVVACLAGLDQLARWQLARQLRVEAVASLGVLARGDTPLRWQLQNSSDLVGGRVFGDCAHEFTPAGLHLRAGSQVCELGLRLRGAVDLGRFDRLQIDSKNPLPAFFLLLRERLDQPQRHAEVSAGTSIALDTLAWHQDDGSAATPPRRAAMLRLRLAGLQQDLLLRDVVLRPAAALPVLSPDSAQWQSLEDTSAIPPQRLPLFAAADGLRPEQLLAARDRLREREPFAQVVYRRDTSAVAAAVGNGARRPPDATAYGGKPAASASTTMPASPVSSILPWLALTAFAALLAALYWRPPQNARVAALLQALAAVALPLYLVASLHLSDDFDAWTLTALALSLLYAAALALRQPRLARAWLGTPRAWLLAALGPALAVLLVGAAQWGSGASLSLGLSWNQLPLYVLWAALQQWLICRVFAERLRGSGLAPHWIALAAALAFALLHTPNTTLMQATFAGGLLWGTIWLRERGLWPIALSHALAAGLLVQGLPPPLLRSAEVSLRFFL